MTDKMQNALRHVETSVDVDEWAMVTVKECFEKLDKIEQIVMVSPDEFKQCGLKELKQILEVLQNE